MTHQWYHYFLNRSSSWFCSGPKHNWSFPISEHFRSLFIVFYCITGLFILLYCTCIGLHIELYLAIQLFSCKYVTIKLSWVELSWVEFRSLNCMIATFFVLASVRVTVSDSSSFPTAAQVDFRTCSANINLRSKCSWRCVEYTEYEYYVNLANGKFTDSSGYGSI